MHLEAEPGAGLWTADRAGKTLAVPIALSLVLHVAVLLAVTIFVLRRTELPPTPIEQSVALVFEPASAPAPVPPAPAEVAPPQPPDVAPSSQPETQASAEPPPQAPATSRPAPVTPTPTEDAYRSAMVQLPTPPAHSEQRTHRPSAPPALRPLEAHPAQPPVPQSSSSAAQPVAAGPIVPPRPVAGMETNRAPAYPEMARRRGEEGRVMLRVSVSATGTPVDVAVASTTGYPVLDTAALSAVRQWRFIPATQAGKPVAAVADVPILFRLEN